MNSRLTKSKYCKGLNCHKALYLAVKHKELATPPGPSQQLRFDEGHAVGELAQRDFPGGVLVSEDHTQLEQAIETTRKLIADKNVPSIYEATFVYEDVLCRVDILKRNSDDTWDIYEVKSTKKLKDEHHDDVAIQLWILEKCGLKIKNVFLKHINPDFLSPNWKDYFKDRDLTDIARSKALKEVSNNIQKQKLILEQDKAPEIRLGSYCSNPYPCEFKDHCWKNVPNGSSLELYRSRKKYDIYYDHSEFIHEIIPSQTKLTEFQNRQWIAATQNESVIDLQGIRKELQKLEFPLYFFDFETIAPAIPILDGMSSYQRIPVQWSCHVQRTPDSKVEHFEYLIDPDSKEDPRLSCAKSLEALFKEGFGTVIAYHESFEKGVIKELAEQVPEHSKILNESLDHFWDLEKIFQKYYYNQEMTGSCSIKSVLPHFAPELSYKDLEIQEGGSAEAWLNQLCRGKECDLAPDQIKKNLFEYCKRDTEAMLVIFEKLLNLFDKFEWKKTQAR